MIRVWVEVSGEATRHMVGVEAESIEQAVRLARASYPDCRVKAHFPIDPSAFFFEGPVAAVGAILPEARRSWSRPRGRVSSLSLLGDRC